MAMSALATADSLKYYFTASSVATRPSARQVALHTAYPGVNGASNEVTDGTYARQTATFTLDATDPDAPFVKNSALITYPAADTGFTVTHISIHAVGGDCLAVMRLVADKVIGAGDQAQFAIGEIIIGGTPQ